ncbi:hypothetical protein JB92DRAFT_3125605 [Gautieria morchelliformis]|nr:hypothetical protein JB92DRAFT_3125605 [Gautieria morchelliformis]
MNGRNMKEGGAAHTIKFKKTTCSVDPASKRPNITEHEEILSGLLNDSPIILAAAYQGRSKDVFKLIIGQQTYAAKRSGDPKMPYMNTLLASFTEEFFEEVRGQGIEVEAFTITEAFIIQVVQETAEDINHAYLVEPLRSSTATIKFSGTLTNRVASGRRAAGVDLQGNINVVNQVATLTLFDPQSHSVTAKSGSGDHGPEGIQAFIDSHCCTAVCHSMQLLPVEDMNETFTRVLEDNQAEEVAQLDMPLELGKFVED